MGKADVHNLSKNTIQNYRYTLDGYTKYCDEQGIVKVNEVKQSTIKMFLRMCANKETIPTA
jgi:site-specific recombinase XerD